MSTAAAAPQIPPRPARSQHAAGPGPARVPEIPPRPAHKRLDRSVSPSHFPQSPLYDPPSSHALARSVSNEPSNLGLPPRPPSVTLPSIGQEGNEYADINYTHINPADSIGPEGIAQMRSIGGDLKLHAPKPSLSQASAKAQVKAVTRTDDQQAAAHGFGKAATPALDDPDSFGRSPKLRSASIPGSGSQPSRPSSRRQSIAPGEEEQGPAELGLRVPINPNMGDVQAPSPAPFSTVSDHQGPGKRRHHSRTKSGREVYLPPGSYGLHGHGLPAHDKFDKDWYAKHPDQLVHEETIGHGHYSSTGSGRGEWALSSDDLNKIVRQTASRGAGSGTHEGVMSYPDEQIGYLASDQYSSRMATPSQGGGYLHKLHSNNSQPAIESPLRKASFPAEDVQKSEFDRAKSSMSGKSDAIDSEAEEDVIHVDDPARRYNKISGGEETVHETEDLGFSGGNTPDHGGYIDESGYGVPILASDEVAKDVGSEHLQPAVSPKQERRGSAYHGGDEYGSGNITPTSRPTSRPASIHGVSASLSRFVSRHEDREEMHTPLEDVDEYEPLFPDDDENKKRPISTADRFRPRPDTLKHRFPSQDIWEDTPSSAMHVATVSTPDLAAQSEPANAKPASQTFEDPHVEAARKGEVSEAERAKLLPNADRLARSSFAPHLRDDMPTRPGMQQRFPSRDIWEDTPDSMQLVTTVTSLPPTGEEAKTPEDAPSDKPSIPPRPANRSNLGESSTNPSVPVSAQNKQPQIPARPPKRTQAFPPDAKPTDVKGFSSQTVGGNTSPTEAKKGPSLPDRPKPPVPARPAKKASLEALASTSSADSLIGQNTATAPPPLPKSKPSIPARVGGGKGNLPTTFISDLNQRLQLGPRPVIKEKEPELADDKEAQPLADARKGRAKGPQRRAPAKSPPNGSTETPPISFSQFSISSPRVLWSIGEDDGLTVNTTEYHQPLAQDQAPKVVAEDTDSKASAAASAPSANVPNLLAPTGLILNTAGESADPKYLDSATATPGTEKSDPLSKSIHSLAPENKEGFSSLSNQTTTGSSVANGPALERVESRNEETTKPSTEGRAEPGTLPKATTASSAVSGEPLKEIRSQEARNASGEKASEKVPVTEAGAEATSQEAPGPDILTSSRFENDDVGGGEGQDQDSKHVRTGRGEIRTESGIKTKASDEQREERAAAGNGNDYTAEEKGTADDSKAEQ